MQATEIALGHGVSSGDLWKLGYEYGELNSNGTVDTAKNTGNIARQTVSFSGLAQPFVQSYKYDSLYRLTEAKETSNGNQTWLQQFGYDRYGNRTSTNQSVNGSSITTPPAVDANTNRFTSTNFQYDKNGNITHDLAMSNQSRTFVFNADNKQNEVKDANGSTVGQYYYDGEGKRVKKYIQSTGETTIFVYSSGKLIAEYSTVVAPASVAKVAYTTTDHLGSPRVITDALGQVASRRDFMPFGEDLNVGVGNRTGDTGLKYSMPGDNVRQKFTGYQKDNETQLDFAEARMYENRFGRFTAVDPLLASGKSANPQTFNRYSYTSNNPIIRVDENGKDWYIAFKEVNGRYYTIPEWCEGLGCGSTYLYKWGSSGSFQREGRRYTYSSSFAFEDRLNGGYGAVDFYENRKGLFASPESAINQVRAWNIQAQVNFIAGALSGYSLIFEFSGAAAGMKAETRSQMFAMGQRAGTGASIAAAVTGVGLVNALVSKFGRGAISILKDVRVASGALSSFEHAGVFGFGTYRELKTAVGTGTDLQVHHLIEKRFAALFGQKESEMLSIVLTKGEHAAFNQAWINEIGRDGMKSLLTTSTATRADVEAAARKIYANNPEILKALGL